MGQSKNGQCGAQAPLLRIVGEVSLEFPSGTLATGQQAALVTFLHCGGPASRSAVVNAVWGGRRISDQRVANLMAELRAGIGRAHFPEPTDGRYSVHSVPTDLERFQATIRSLAEPGEQALDLEALGHLRAACRLIRGAPFTTGMGKHWIWLDQRLDLVTSAEAAITAGVHQGAELAAASGDLATATTVLEAGLLACPLDEDLIGALIRLYLAQRRPGTARRLVDSWERQVRRLGCGEPSSGPRDALLDSAQAVSIGSAVTTRLPR